MDLSRLPAGWGEKWQRSWDRLEQDLAPDREVRIGVLVDVVDAIAAPAPTVLDLGCGTGTVTHRLLDRLPHARSITVDVDPVLLTIASASFLDDDRVHVVHADLRDPRWVDMLPERRVDAALTATALHWLPEHAVRRLYDDLAGLVRPGGVVAHTEVMPLVELPHLAKALHRPGRSDPRQRWDTWWEQASRDPMLHAAMAQRRAIFATTYPTTEFSPPADWHIRALKDAGFAEAGLIWRSGPAAVVAAVR